MTKKDYQAIARILYQYDKSQTDGSYYSLIQGFADMLRADNPNFDFDRFQEACLTGKCKGMKA